MTKRFVIPFATSGDKSVTPDATDPGGAISYSQGWPVAYQLADTDPNYRPVGRQEMNGVLFDVTGALAEIQSLGAPEWVAVTGLVTPYAINAVLRHNGVVWRNTVANNSVEPGTDNTWVVNVADETLATAGTAPAFTLTPTPAIPAYGAYQRFRVQFNATPVGTPTLNVSTRGAKNLKQYNSAGAKVAAVIVLGLISDVVYDGTDFVVLDPLPPPTLTLSYPPGYLSGFQLSNNSGAPNTTIGVAAGYARDSANAVDINLATTIRGILQSSGSWAAGDNQNKLDTGAKAINSWYHVFAIRKTSDGTGDILLSLSATAPTMPSGYSGFRRISSVRTDGSGNIIAFFNVGRLFTFLTPIVDFTASVATPVLVTLSVPTGVNVVARFWAAAYGAGDAGLVWTAPSANSITYTAPNATYTGGSGNATSAADSGSFSGDCIAENAQVRFGGLATARVLTYGWEEF